MSLTINHNLMASNTARNLNSHYANLSTSVRRLSSGLRVNSSADDAAGLAIRELMRADIASLNQGVRNVNDAVSMIQTADGALQIIDEKLIRMKELAEQAATGTYNSDQRLMIDSEFQAMKAEIDRIAKATDFNGVKLLCNDPANKIILRNAQQYYTDVKDYEAASGSLPIDTNIIIHNSDAITKDSNINFQYYDLLRIQTYYGDDNIKNYTGPDLTIFKQDGSNEHIVDNENYTIKYTAATDIWEMVSKTGPGELFEFYTVNKFNVDFGNGVRSTGISFNGFSDSTYTRQTASLHITPWYSSSNKQANENLQIDTVATFKNDHLGFWASPRYDNLMMPSQENSDYKNANVVNDWGNGSPGYEVYDGSMKIFDIDLDGDRSTDISVNINMNGQNNRHPFPLRRFTISLLAQNAALSTTKVHFGTGNDSAEDYYYIDTKDCTANGLGIAGTSIETQDKAQRALEEIDNAVIKKDTARAYFGAMQNRLENTASNLRIQAENLRASESRISDVDVSTEMTAYVRSQILTQAAVAMLSQANSLPNMALQLITNQ